MLRKLHEGFINGKYNPEEKRAYYRTTIRKKVSQKDLKIYRGKAVICTIGRIYSKVLRNLIGKETGTGRSEERSRLRACRSKIDKNLH
jgi:hypothetical protein